MIITATPEPSNFPPRVRLDIDGEGGEFVELSVLRDGRPVRMQPPIVGLTSTHTYDYEAPFGATVSYTASGRVTTGAWTTVLTETWASLTGWDTSGGTPSVAAGKLQNGRVRRTGLAIGPIGSVTLDTSGSDYEAWVGPIHILRNSGSLVDVFFKEGGDPPTTVPTAGSITVTWNASSAVVTHAAGTSTLLPSGTVARDDLTAQGGDPLFPSGWVNGTMAGFTYSVPSGTVAADASTTATLDVGEAWLIHPSQPSLSTAIESPSSPHGRDINVQSSTDSERTYQARQAIYQPNGRREAVVFPLGPRAAGAWTLVLDTRTIEARNDLLNLLDDQAPVLLRSPGDADWDLPDGWYAVGDVSVSRPISIGSVEDRQLTLPLTRVAEPPVLVAPSLTWGDLMLRGYTWGDLLPYTWLDLLMGEL